MVIAFHINRIRFVSSPLCPPAREPLSLSLSLSSLSRNSQFPILLRLCATKNTSRDRILPNE